MDLSSTVFALGGYIPRKCTCEGDDIAPAPRLLRPIKADLERAMQGHVLAQAQLVGTYQKQKGGAG